MVSPAGKYLGKFLRLGQGPGEFPAYSGIRFFLKSNEIIVSGGRKLARFDKMGKLISEKKVENIPDILLDENHYFIHEVRGRPGNREEKIIVKERTNEETNEFKDTVFFEAKNVGMIYTETVSFADTWATPRIVYAYDHNEFKFYVALNTEYKIYVKNLDGEIQYVIEREYEIVHLSLEDKKELAFNESLVPAYPDKLVILQKIFPLPQGYLGVKRVSGPKKFEVDVFDPDGRYVYMIKLDDVMLFNSAQYFPGGFAIVKESDDGMLYQEFRVKNLPDIFKQ